MDFKQTWNREFQNSWPYLVLCSVTPPTTVVEVIIESTLVILWARFCLGFVFSLTSCTFPWGPRTPTASSSDASSSPPAFSPQVGVGGDKGRGMQYESPKPHEPKKKIKKYLPSSNMSLNSSNIWNLMVAESILTEMNQKDPILLKYVVLWT